MQNFVYCNPTELVFGRGAHKEIGMRMLPWAKDGKKALVIYGGGSAKRSGVLDDVVAGCEAAGLTVVVKGGVKPNPEMDFVREVTAFARAENVNLIIAVGGGSVIDTAKAVAASVPYAGDGWDFFTGKVVPETCLPVGAVLTIPAAGSESSIRCVITQGNEKFGMGNGVIRPKVAAINPELFFTLPKKQVAAGVIDMMSHIMERYFTNTPAVDYTSGQAEAALKTIMANGLKVMENVRDYDVRWGLRAPLRTTATSVSGLKKTGPATAWNMLCPGGTPRLRTALGSRQLFRAGCAMWRMPTKRVLFNLPAT